MLRKSRTQAVGRTQCCSRDLDHGARDGQAVLVGEVGEPLRLGGRGHHRRHHPDDGARRLLGEGLTHRYLDRVIAVATVDDVVLDAFVSVVHLVRPPSILFKPGILARVLRGPRRPLLTAPPTSTP